MPRDLSKDPVDRLGVYKRYADVPARYRLSQHEAEYRGRDVWQEFLDKELLAKERSERYRQDVHRVGRYWKDHLDDRGTHHALAKPADVEAWCAWLLEGRNLGTVYLDYWAKLERFYDWLLYHPDHPHCYNPVLMAALEGKSASRVWEQKVNRREKYG